MEKLKREIDRQVLIQKHGAELLKDPDGLIDASKRHAEVTLNWLDQETKALRQELEEKEQTIKLMRTEAPEVWYRMEEQVKKIKELNFIIERQKEAESAEVTSLKTEIQSLSARLGELEEEKKQLEGLAWMWEGKWDDLKKLYDEETERLKNKIQNLLNKQ